MKSIYQKAQQQQAKAFCQEILDKLKELPADTPNWQDALENILDDITSSEEQPSEKKTAIKKECWDFSHEKSQAMFVCGDRITIRPITPADADFYRNIRMQYSLIYRSAYYTIPANRESLFRSETAAPEVFYCIIEANDGTPIGYLGIKDTSAELWEIAIELDGKYTHQGFGPQGIRLYLNEIQRITGKSKFMAAVEADNIPSQKCFERLGAKLVGLRSSIVLKTDEEKERFEQKNLNLITAHIIELAKRLDVAPRKLLSHVLEYRLNCPLRD